ncbi:MAG: CxxC-x17-CxxC domain-containing protein [Candidatus Paceibacterota bacterium]
MGNFQGGGNRGGGSFRSGNGGGNRGGGYHSGSGSDRGEKTMYKAVCDECHKSCEVPFRPSSDKPVYCNDCFASKRKDDDRAPRRDFGDRGPKRDYNASPAQSSFAKPAVVQGDMSKQLADISAKLDRLISAIEKLTQPKVETKPMAKIVPVIKKTIAVKTVTKKVVAKKTK